MKQLIAKVCFTSSEVAASSGQVFSCSDELAKDLVKAGYAEEKRKITSKGNADRNEIKRSE